MPQELTMTVRKYGYLYTLVLTDKRLRSNNELPEACFMGFQGYALKTIEKIKIKKNRK